MLVREGEREGVSEEMEGEEGGNRRGGERAFHGEKTAQEANRTCERKMLQTLHLPPSVMQEDGHLDLHLHLRVRIYQDLYFYL